MCLIPNKTRPSRPSSAGAAAAATVPGGGSELGPPRGSSPGGGRREVVVRGCAVPIQAKHELSHGQEMLCCTVQDEFHVCHLVSSPMGMGRSWGWVQGRVSVGAAWVTLPAAPGHGHEDGCVLGGCGAVRGASRLRLLQGMGIQRGGGGCQTPQVPVWHCWGEGSCPQGLEVPCALSARPAGPAGAVGRGTRWAPTR